MGEYRDLRRRIEAGGPGSSPGTGRPCCPARLVEVVDGGHKPASLPGVFACRDVTPGGDESEGAAAPGAGDAARPLFVTVYGSAVPDAGAQLVARLVRGRWVAGSGGAAPGLDCSPCAIPRKDLLFTWETPTHAAESFRLVYYAAVPGNLGLTGPRWVCGPLQTVGRQLATGFGGTSRPLYNSADPANPIRGSAFTGITEGASVLLAGAHVTIELLCDGGNVTLNVQTLDVVTPAEVAAAAATGSSHFLWSDPAYAAVDNYSSYLKEGMTLPRPASNYASPVFDPQYPDYESTCGPFRLRWAVRHNTALLYGLVTVTTAP